MASGLCSKPRSKNNGAFHSPEKRAPVHPGRPGLRLPHGMCPCLRYVYTESTRGPPSSRHRGDERAKGRTRCGGGGPGVQTLGRGGPRCTGQGGLPRTPLAADTGPRELCESHGLSESEFTGRFRSCFHSREERSRSRRALGVRLAQKPQVHGASAQGPTARAGPAAWRGLPGRSAPRPGCLGQWWGWGTPEQSEPKLRPSRRPPAPMCNRSPCLGRGEPSCSPVSP